MPPNQPPRKPIPQGAASKQKAPSPPPVPPKQNQAPQAQGAVQKAGAPKAQNAGQNPPQNAQRKIEGFDPTAFAANIAKEASQVIPMEFSEEDTKFIVDTVHKFCFLCGDALVKDANYNLNAQQAGLITQFIGEWTFHKSADLIRGGIGMQLREGVLQKVAFTVFEVAKRAVAGNLPQEQVITVIEKQVKNCFAQAIEDLKAKGRINEEIAKNTMSQSNVDMMTQAELDQEQALGKDLSDAKILKLATLALFIKKLPQEKVKKIVSKFNSNEALVLQQYLRVENLEEKIDKNLTIKCLEEIKDILPEPKVISMDRVYLKLFKIAKNNDKNKISDIIDNERPLIKEFVLSPYTKEECNIPAKIGNVICKYLEEKLSQK